MTTNLGQWEQEPSQCMFYRSGQNVFLVPDFVSHICQDTNSEHNKKEMRSCLSPKWELTLRNSGKQKCNKLAKIPIRPTQQGSRKNGERHRQTFFINNCFEYYLILITNQNAKFSKLISLSRSVLSFGIFGFSGPHCPFNG